MDEGTPVNHSKEINHKLLGDYTPLEDIELEHLVGAQFIRNMRQYRDLSETFGLCGVAALDAAGKYTMPAKWQSVNYDAADLKLKFDNKDETGEGLDGISTFIDVNRVKLASNFDTDNYRAVTNVEDWERLLASLPGNTAISVGYFCEFLNRGSYTHWVAAKPSSIDSIVLLGDFSPFGIQNFGIKMTKQNLLAGISKTIGAESTVKFQGLDAEERAKAYRANTELITQNVFIYRFN